MRIRNWKKFQHYDTTKRSAPPWVRLYRTILDDHEWSELDGEAAKVLVMLWLLASESDGRLPTSVEKLSFRLRTTEANIIKHLSKLTHWVECPASSVLAPCYQDACLEQSRADADTEQITVRCFSEEAFAEFWKLHPYGPKKDAREAYRKARGNGAPSDHELLTILRRQVQERKDAEASGEFCARLPHLFRWFMHHRWEDAPMQKTAPTTDPETMKRFLAGELE